MRKGVKTKNTFWKNFVTESFNQFLLFYFVTVYAVILM